MKYRLFILLVSLGLIGLLPLHNAAQNCVVSTSISLSPPPNPLTGCYPAGSTITVCVSLTNYTQGGINWIHGIVVSLGPGWNAATLAPVSISPSCDGFGTWGWYTSCTSTNTGQTFGPGFYYDTPLGSTTGIIDGIPGNNYGDNCTNFTWNFCYSVTTNTTITTQQSGNIGVIVYGDYTTGSWTIYGCAPQPVTTSYCIQQNCTVQLPTLNITNVACHGDSTGSAFAAASGGFPPYSYLWSTGATTQSITGLPAGIYSVTVTDAAGCTKNVFFQITQPGPILDSASITHVGCSTANIGSITPNISGGVPPYSYLWSNGNTTPTISGLAAGTYTLTLTDSAGCVKNFTYNVIGFTPVSFTATATPATCAQNNGTISISINSGTAPYTYQWSPPVAAGPNATNLAAGIYTITVTDINGCSQSQTVTVSEIPSFSLSIQSTPVGCTGTGATATVTVNGGVGPFTYQWSPSGGTGPTATNLGPGTYTVTVTDSVGCSLSASVTIDPYTPMSLTPSTVNAQCDNPSTGAASVTVNGGNPPYSYQWSNGATGSSITNITPGIYTVTVTDASNCTEGLIINVGQNPQVFVSISGNNDLCEGQSTTLTATASGGSGGNQYLWSNGNSATGITVTPPAGVHVYTVTVTDITGCTASATYSVNVTAYPVLTTSGDVTICSGESIQLSASGAQTYSWSPNIGLNNPQSPNPVATPSVTTTYTVTGANGSCTATATLTVTVSPPVVASALPEDTIGTPPLTVNFINQSSGAISYFWDFGDGNTSILTNPQHVFTTPGVYNVMLVATNSDGCTDTFYVRVEVELISSLTVPNVFTPNNDGVNDLLSFIEDGIAEIKAEIYNRWGEKIYEWNKLAFGWNGIAQNGKEVPEGTYFIIVKATGLDGKKYEIAKSFLLLRSGKEK
jgi:gliding motility-associated-like protein